MAAGFAAMGFNDEQIDAFFDAVALVSCIAIIIAASRQLQETAFRRCAKQMLIKMSCVGCLFAIVNGRKRATLKAIS